MNNEENFVVDSWIVSDAARKYREKQKRIELEVGVDLANDHGSWTFSQCILVAVVAAPIVWALVVIYLRVMHGIFWM